jgi:hypothetical protein
MHSVFLYHAIRNRSDKQDVEIKCCLLLVGFDLLKHVEDVILDQLMMLHRTVIKFAEKAKGL